MNTKLKIITVAAALLSLGLSYFGHERTFEVDTDEPMAVIEVISAWARETNMIGFDCAKYGLDYGLDGSCFEHDEVQDVPRHFVVARTGLRFSGVEVALVFRSVNEGRSSELPDSLYSTLTTNFGHEAVRHGNRR